MTPKEDRVPEAAQVLRRAESLVCGDRRTDYGSATTSFASLATIFTTLLGDALTRPLDAHEVAILLAALKLWRCTTAPLHMDSWTDLAGYAGLGWEVAVDGSRTAAAVAV
jgi:hypothetical protein